MKLSIFIPVFRESEHLEKLIKNLLSDSFKDKEIFVIVDEPSEKTLELARKYKGKVNFILNKERKGKVNAINENIWRAKGEIIIFLDADVEINEENFLSIVYDKIKDAVLLDIKKEIIQNSALSKLIAYEYLAYDIVNYVLSKTTGQIFMLNGAGFAIKKEALLKIGGLPKLIVEDVAVALESIKHKLKCKFCNEVGIRTEAPNSIKSYIKQRIRWGSGGGEVIKKYKKELLKYAMKNFWIVLPCLLIYYPPVVLLIFLPMLLHNLFYGLIATTTFLIFLSGTFILFSKKLKVKVHLTILPLYYLYINFSFLVLLIFSIQGFTKRKSLPNWKV